MSRETGLRYSPLILTSTTTHVLSSECLVDPASPSVFSIR